MRTEHHADARAIPRRMQRPSSGAWGYPPRPANGKNVADLQCSSAEWTDAAGQAGRTAPQHRLNSDPSLDREDGACAGQTRTKADPLPGSDDEWLARARPPVSYRHLEFRAGDYARHIFIRQQLRSHQRDLERGIIVCIPEALIGEPMGEPVHRARRGNADVLLSPTAKVLDGGEHARSDDGEGGHQGPVIASYSTREMLRKRTVSPGRNNTGSARDSSNGRTAVRPMRCQPPGVSIG